MAAANTTASTVPSTVTAAAAVEAASVPAAGAAAADDDEQDVEKLTTKLGSSLTYKGKFKGLILKINCQHLQKLFLF